MAKGYALAIKGVPWTLGSAMLVFLAPWIILPFVLLFWLQLLSPFLPMAKSLLEASDNGDPTFSLVLIGVDAVGSLLLIGYFLRKYGATWRDLGLRRFKVLRAVLHIVGIYAVFFLAVTLLLALVAALLPGFNPDQEQTNEFTGLGPNFQLYSLLALVIIPPLIEEPVFRGYMFPAFAKRFGIAGGAFASSLLFGIAHLQGNVTVYTFVLGLLLCYLYSRTGSIVPGIILHMINNFIAYTALG